MRGVIITATVTTPVVVGVARPNIASLIAWAAAAHQALPSLNDAISIVKIPLVKLLEDADGKPLWAGTDIYPIGDAIEGREYLHKRYPAHRANLGRKMKINTAAGQFKERRKPIKTLSCSTWRAAALIECDIDDLHMLLDDCRSVGPNGAAGYGAVHRWHIEDSPHVDETFILARRPVPAAANLATGPVKPLRAWVPPYWHSPWWADCTEGQPCF